MENRIGLIALESAHHSGEKVNKILEKWRGESFLIPCECPRFNSGEAKGILKESVRERDIYIMVDICNSSLTYKMDNQNNRMSPDDHYQDLKRIIAACNDKASRITVIMPFLYEGRQHRKTMRESLDCAIMLQELKNMGVRNIVTFDAHDSRMHNVIPIGSMENISPALQFTQGLLTEYEDIRIDADHLMFIAPDEGATDRVIFFATLFGVNIGMFYKRRDYTRIVDGKNPIISHEFCGGDVNGMDVIVVDDMIDSGGSMLDVCRQLKARGAGRVFIFSTFGLFSKGFEKFDNAYEEGAFEKIFTTNLVYQKPELLAKDYYFSINMERYIAAIIDTLNKGASLEKLTKPADRIIETIRIYKNQ